MKKVNSSVIPSPYEIRKKTDKEVFALLRDNIEEKTREGEEGTSTYYEYDEIEIKIPLTQDAEQYIEDNFEALFIASSPEKSFAKITELQELLADTIEEVLLA